MRSDLFDLVYRFYPRGLRDIHRMYVPAGEPVYEDTEEHLRLVEAAKRGKDEYATWQAMYRRLDVHYSVQNESIKLLANWVDPAYSARIWLVGDTALSFHVSLIGPYYGLHLPGIPEEQPVAREVIREIEATYPGYWTIPPEIGNEVVPDVSTGNGYGDATIYKCIFSEVWTWVNSV